MHLSGRSRLRQLQDVGGALWASQERVRAQRQGHEATSAVAFQCGGRQIVQGLAIRPNPTADRARCPVMEAHPGEVRPNGLVHHAQDLEQFGWAQDWVQGDVVHLNGHEGRGLLAVRAAHTEGQLHHADRLARDADVQGPHPSSKPRLQGLQRLCRALQLAHQAAVLASLCHQQAAIRLKQGGGGRSLPKRTQHCLHQQGRDSAHRCASSPQPRHGGCVQVS